MRPGIATNRLLPLLYLALAGIGWLALGRVYAPDVNFVTYRFAANLAAGHGLVYLTPDPAVSTYPLVPALLAIPARLGIPLPVAGGIFSIIAIAIGAVFLTRLVHDQWIAGIAYVLATAAQPSPVVLTMLALALTGLDAARQQRWALTGTLIGLAILTEPSAIVLAILLVFLIIREGGSLRRYLPPVILIPLAVLGVMITTLGLRAPFHETFTSFAHAVAALAIPVVAILTLARCWQTLREIPCTAVLLAWGGITLLFALITETPITAVTLPGLIALSTQLPWRPRAVLFAAACLDLALGIALPAAPLVPPGSESLGRWFLENSTPDVTIATGEIGALAFYANRSVADLSGNLHKNAFDTAFFAHYAPDYVILREGMTAPDKPFKTSYASVQSAGGRTIFARVVYYSQLNEHGVDVPYGNPIRYDLRLTKIAMGDILHPGDLVRVRLDWELAYMLPYLAEVKMTLLNEQGLPIVGQVDAVIPYRWPIGKTSSYHLFMLPSDIPPGRVRLYLGVRLRDALSTELEVASADVVKR